MSHIGIVIFVIVFVLIFQLVVAVKFFINAKEASSIFPEDLNKNLKVRNVSESFKNEIAKNKEAIKANKDNIKRLNSEVSDLKKEKSEADRNRENLRRRINSLKNEVPNILDPVLQGAKIVELQRLINEHNRCVDVSTELQEQIEDYEDEIKKREKKIQNREKFLKMYDTDAKCIAFQNADGETIFNTIIDNINKYLLKNASSVADYHLIKDIVDRNCDSKEEEIATWIPFPLYSGLAGTMIGIIVGVISLSSNIALQGDSNTISVQTIEPLLKGVGWAMTTSFFGVLLTVWTSWYHKSVQEKETKRRNEFLSWIQAELLPTLSTDISGTLSKMVTNLNGFNEKFSKNTKDFNSTFSKNTNDLQTTLSSVKDTSVVQKEILDTISELDVKKIATANIKVYEKLKNCTEEIGRLGDYLTSVQQYLANVRDLNNKLDASEERMKMFERLALFFERWENELSQRKGEINHVIADVDKTLDSAKNALMEKTQQQLDDFVRFSTEQRQRLEELVAAMPRLVKEMNSLPSLEKITDNLQRTTVEQNNKLNNLAAELKNLSIEVRNFAKKKSEEPIKISTKVRVPKIWKVAGAIAIGIIAVNSLISIINWFVENFVTFS